MCCNDNIRMLQTYISSVSHVLDVCRKCFHLDVSKVDLGVAHVAMAIQACFKCIRSMSQMFLSGYFESRS
jgi:hypothetical protein